MRETIHSENGAYSFLRLISEKTGDKRTISEAHFLPRVASSEVVDPKRYEGVFSQTIAAPSYKSF